MSTHEPVESLDALTRDDPAWLAQRRRDAWSRKLELPYPTGREETWRYTDVERLRDERFPHPDLSEAGLPQSLGGTWKALAQDAGASAVLVNGAPAEIQVGPDLARQGVRLLPLSRAAREHPALVQAHLGRLVGPKDVFTARSLALHRGGLLLHVPAGVQAELPVRWLHGLGTPGGAVETRALVILERDASLHLEDHLRSDALGAPTRIQPVVELFLAPGARLTYVGLQTWGAGVHQLAHIHAHLDRDAHFTSLLGGFGADFARTRHRVILAGPGAEADLLGVYFPTGEQHHELWTEQQHLAPHTRSDLLYKGALGGAGRAVYYGTIQVGPEARRTDAYQANRNLLLSEASRVDTNPQLEIETNDVRCTHGASVGQVDDAQLFYLMSRGLPRPEAERLLVVGFFSEVLSRLGAAAPAHEDRFTALIREKLNTL